MTGELGTYRHKRDFGRTPEPRGEVSGRSLPGRFVIQKHDARRLHYDFRLEHAGVLKSWAVPKGPSLDPAEKRLAVETEDHPLDYGDFEGVIPAGEYGAGPVLVWDRGRWFPAGDVERGLRDGKLEFRLEGERLRGRWTLVRMRRDERGRANWLLIKGRDDEARSGASAEVVARWDDSVLTGRDIGAIRSGTPPPGEPSTVGGAREAPIPRRPSPQLATLVKTPPSGEGWLHEPKLDGYRLLVRIEDGEITSLTRAGNDWTDRFPGIAEAAARLRCQSAILDGEAVILDRRGISRFESLQRAISAGGADVLLVAFDLLYLDGWDLRGAALRDRKALLRPLVAGAGMIRFGEHFAGAGEAFFREACDLGLEGVVSKRAESTYEGKRSRRWLKSKCAIRATLPIVGFSEPSGSRPGLGALLLGSRDAPGQPLRYAGKVGTGFSDATLVQLRARLERLERPTAAVSDPPRGAKVRGVHWIEPELSAEVELAEWTKQGIMRHPRFVGLAEPAPARPQSQKTGKIQGVALSNPDKVLYPDSGITKRALAGYYEAVADLAVPHLRDRPLTLVRCPNGIEEGCFYQKQLGSGVLEAIKRIAVKDESEPYSMIDDAAGLIALVQLGVLEIHAWGARAGDLERPDIVVFDLDPSEELPFGAVVEAALELRERLARLDLESFVRVTGGKGLHVVVPLIPGPGWDGVKGFAAALARYTARDDPDRFTAVMSKERRTGKIFVDYLRNTRESTAIASYSARARPGAPVALPVAWDDLDPEATRPPRYGVLEVPGLIAGRPDPWADFEQARRPLDELLRGSSGSRR